MKETIKNKVLKEVWTGHDDLKILIPTSKNMKPIVEHIKNRLEKAVDKTLKEVMKIIDGEIKKTEHCRDTCESQELDALEDLKSKIQGK